MNKKLLFIFNPYSGKGEMKRYLFEAVDTFVKKGYDVTVYPTQKAMDAVEKVEADASNYDRIICSGGDGTLDEVVEAVMRSGADVPIGYIPAGSTNDFGSSLGIVGSILSSIETSVSERTFACDIGQFENQYFVYVAAFGIFTDVSYETPQEMKNMLGHTAYILQGVKSIFDVPNFRIKVTYDDGEIEDEFIYGMVTNSNSVGGFKNMLPEDVDLCDGLFEVTLIKTPKNPIELNDILVFLSGVSKESEFVYTFKTKSIHFSCEKDVPFTLDGEFGGEYRDVDIVNINKAVTFVV